MKLILRSLNRYRAAVTAAIFIKLLGTMAELLLPYILEHIIDDVVPMGELAPVFLWGGAMFAVAVLTRALNVSANRKAVGNAHRISYEIRQELFEKTINLSGPDFDRFGLPSLISRMTSDSYNVQSAVQQFQTLCVRAPIMLIGGLLVSLMMDTGLAMILVVLLPFLIAVILFVSSRGIPMYTAVQQKLDAIVRIMRENITGIRVVRALSKEDYEIRRFGAANREMTQQENLRCHSFLDVLTDFERISDHARNIAESAQELKEKNLVFSAAGQQDMDALMDEESDEEDA